MNSPLTKLRWRVLHPSSRLIRGPSRLEVSCKSLSRSVLKISSKNSHWRSESTGFAASRRGRWSCLGSAFLLQNSLSCAHRFHQRNTCALYIFTDRKNRRAQDTKTTPHLTTNVSP